MIIALFVIAAAVMCVPIAAVVLVAMASHREESALSLDKPARGVTQLAARRLLDFHSDDPAWPLPKNSVQARSAAPVLHSVDGSSVREPRRSTMTDTPRPVVRSKVSIRTAA